ncbi:MAG: hypothetical protein ACI87E_000910 [Mariniblastus sp.]|jgi:hypothetical protein
MEKPKLLDCLIAVPALGFLAILAIPCIWAFLYFGVYLGYGNFKVRGHQEFATHGVSQIEPAKQMDQIYDDCRHYITYSGHNDVPLFNSVAYFGARYELVMQVPVKIRSEVFGETIGEPSFYLHEISRINTYGSGQFGASYSRDFRFTGDEWNRVVAADGDFSVIGFDVRSTPVPDFEKYTNASRPSN